MTANEAHDKFGHADDHVTCKTRMAALGVEITRGNMKPCAAYAAAKAKQKSVPKISNHMSLRQRTNGEYFWTSLR
jgi:hypothetical protein